jgi:CBS domain containing-hemolysin-like protein
MNSSYQNLPHELLAPRTSILQHRALDSDQVTPNDSAELVYTDFTHVRPFTISPTATIDQINARMMACGVRLLFVTETDTVLQGLVTYTDLFGEKPIHYIQEHGGTREEILAQDIMTPLAQLEALSKADVLKASVGDIVKTIETAGRQHMLVCHTHENDNQTVIGLFSATHIEKLTGIKLELSTRAHTFADLERALT